MRRVAWCIGVILIAGCAQMTVGRDFEKAKVDQVIVGKTTKQEVLKIMGTPMEKEVEGGLEKWIYVYRVAVGTPRPQWVHLLYRGDMKEKRLAIIFDQDSVMDIVFSETTKPFNWKIGFN